jgi:hypothetical protein
MNDLDAKFPAEGGCDCKAVRYRMQTAPIFVNCCHCRWCQRETGSKLIASRSWAKHLSS